MENIYLKNWRHFDRTIKGLLIRDAMTGELLYDGKWFSPQESEIDIAPETVYRNSYAYEEAAI